MIKEWPKSAHPIKRSPPNNTVAIVMPIHDGVKFIRLAFYSVLYFTDRSYIFIFVNNQSSLETKRSVNGIAKNHNVWLLDNHCEFNYATLCNYGLRFIFQHDTIRYGLILNSDVVVEPYWLSNMINILECNAKVGIVGPSSNRAIPDQENCPRDTFKIVDRVFGHCMLFRREVFDTLNGFDERFIGGGYEDADFCKRAKQAGWLTAVTGHTYVHHFYGMTRRFQKNGIDLIRENKKRFQEKHPEKEIATNDREKLASR